MKLCELVAGYREARKAQKGIDSRVSELGKNGYNGQRMPAFQYCYPLVREFGGQVEALYERARNSGSFAKGMQLYDCVQDWFSPAYRSQDVTIEGVYKSVPEVRESDSRIGELLSKLSQGISELVETLPPEMREEARAKITKEEALPRQVRGNTRPYGRNDIGPKSRN